MHSQARQYANSKCDLYQSAKKWIIKLLRIPPGPNFCALSEASGIIAVLYPSTQNRFYLTFASALDYPLSIADVLLLGVAVVGDRG